MSTLQNILRYINEDFAPPTVRLILVSQNEILLNKIVSKKLTLHEILKEERVKEEKNYILYGKPVNLDQKIIELIPKNYSNLSNIELIIENKSILLGEEKIYYEKILKPFDKPFKVLVFTPNEFNVSIKSYPNETIEKLKLKKFSLKLSSYCNTPDDLYISGGTGDDYTSSNSGNKHFWKINSIKTNIEKLNDLPIDKQNHSMIYIPKRYIYFIGGNNKNTFYYDIFFSGFTSWANMNKPVKNPCLILVNNIYIYSFGNPDINNSGNNFVFERTNLKSANPKWEIRTVNNQILPLRNFGGICISDEIYFLGGRHNRGEKMFKFNTTSENIEICKQENTKLNPLDKNFYELNEYNSVMVPDCDNNENIQIIIFNKIRKKYRKVLFEKNLEEIVNNDNLKNSNLDNSLIRENDQMKIVWKEYKNIYMEDNLLEENILVLPSVEDLKKGNIILKINKDDIKIGNENNDILDNNKDINNEDNIINYIEEQNNTNEKNIIGNIDLNQKEENENNKEFKNKENINLMNGHDNDENYKNMNNIIDNNNMLLEEKIFSYPENQSLKQDNNPNFNNKIDLKSTTEIQPSKAEDKNNLNKNPEDINFNHDISDSKLNKVDIPENEKERSNIPESPTLYKKKTIIKPDKKNSIVIQYENNEQMEVNNKNKHLEKLKDNNTFNIEYNNEIIVGDKKGEMLSDIISSNSEIKMDKTNKGLNNRYIMNVPKTISNEKNDNNNFVTEIKEENNPTNDINLNEKSNQFKIEENPENERPQNEKNNVKHIGQSKDSQNNNDNKKFEGEIFEGIIPGKEKPKINQKIVENKENLPETNENINNVEKEENIKINDENDKNKEEPIVLLDDKIIYHEKDKNKLNEKDLPKENQYEIITGIIKGVPQPKKISDIEKNKNMNELIIEENKSKKGPQTIESIFSGNIDDDIILNKNIPNKLIYGIKEENIKDYENKEFILNKENTNQIIENEIHLPNNTLKEMIPELNLDINGKPIINNQDLKLKNKENLIQDINNIDIIEKDKKADLIVNKNENSIKDSKLDEEPEKGKKENNIIEHKDELIEGIIPGASVNINLNKNEPTEEEKDMKKSKKENENDSSDNSGAIIIDLNIEKEKKKDKNKKEKNSVTGSITGNIFGVPRQKFLVEYGSTKGFKRPNIKKGKDFTHDPEILIEGTIGGNKVIPPTLKSIFEDNINKEIILNNPNLLKPSEYILSEFDIPEYLKKGNDLNISEGNLISENPSSKIKNETKDDIQLNNINEIIISDIEPKNQLNANVINIKNPEIKLESSSIDIKGENPVENIDIDMPRVNIDLEGKPLKAENTKNKIIEEPKIGGIIEVNPENKTNIININVPNINDNIQIEDNNNLNIEENIIEEKIPGMEGKINVIENKEKINIPNLSLKVNVDDNSNIKGEIIEGSIPGMKKEVKAKVDNTGSDLIKQSNLENNKNLVEPKKEELNKKKENQIYESITGSIIGTPRQKFIVEYGNTKGFKRPNIKKGKDFTHNPEILIEGTIGGNKAKISTLKSLFEDKINTNIKLNKNNIKYPEIKLEDYLELSKENKEIIISNNEPQISLISSDLKAEIAEPKIQDLKDEKIDLDIKGENIETEGIKIRNSKNIKEEVIEGVIPSVEGKINNIGNNELRAKGNKPNIGVSINLDNPSLKIEKNKEIIPLNNKSMNVNLKSPNIKEKEKETIIFESITGSIKGIPKQKFLVEYGSTKGYKRPNIKKGKDFTHNPEILIEGTIGGNKIIPPTLKSIFEDKINTNIKLNKKINEEYKIKNKDLSDYLLSLEQSQTKINAPELQLGNLDLVQSDLKTKEEILKGKIKNIDINFNNKESKPINSIEDSSKIDLKNNEIKISSGKIELDMPNIEAKDPSSKGNEKNVKTEIISGIIVGKQQDNLKENDKGTFIKIKNRPNIENNIEKEYIGNIKGIPKPKNKVEYGSTTGYKKPNINKGKDFIHNPEIIIEGTIGGNKAKVPTLKSLFEGKINENFILNNESLKNHKFRIKEEEMPNFGSSNKINFELNPDLKIKLKDSRKDNVDIKEQKSPNQEKDQNITFENITGNIIGTPRQKFLVEYGSTKGFKRPNIKKGKDFTHSPEFVLQGIIEGKKTIESKKDDNTFNFTNKNLKVQLKRSDRLHFIEYGSSLNFVRPVIKKGIDFYHEPKVVLSKIEED